MARKNYSDEFMDDAVGCTGISGGATIAMIADELGASEATLSAWCKARGVSIRHRKPA
jgi:transposase